MVQTKKRNRPDPCNPLLLNRTKISFKKTKISTKSTVTILSISPNSNMSHPPQPEKDLQEMLVPLSESISS